MFSMEARKISLTWPIGVHKHIANEKLNKLFKNAPLVEKLLVRLPQKLQEKILTEEYIVNERIFEKGFCFMQIGKFTDGIKKILDVGCCWSSLPVELASLGFNVWGIDPNNYFLCHPKFTFIKGNVCATPFSDGFFDLVTAISTVEHIGLGHYKEPTAVDGDFKAVTEIHRILKPKGLFILTVPYGKSMVTPVFRVYDETRLNNLIQNFQIIEVEYRISYKELYWENASKEEAAEQGIDERSRNTGNVCLLLKKYK